MDADEKIEAREPMTSSPGDTGSTRDPSQWPSQEPENLQDRRARAVVEAAKEGILVVDDQQAIQVFNKAATEIFGYTPDEIIGQCLDILVPLQHRDSHGSYFDQFRSSERASSQMLERTAIYGRRKDGSEFPAEISIMKIDVDGRTEYAAIIRDISARAALIEELTKRATTDPLTGLANRRVFEERGSEMVALAHRHGQSLSALMLDIDHFKTVNDSHGHAMGDRVLSVFAEIIDAALRTTDLAARYGGEEFLLLLPQTGLEGAVDVAERIRLMSAENSSYFTANSPAYSPVPFTISVGVSSLLAGEQLIDIVHRSDEALYAAKRGGRNRVSVAPANASAP